MAQLIPPILASAFERMGANNKSSEQIATNTGITAASVSVGGALYQKMDELVKALSSGGGGKGKVSIKEALVLRIVGGALKPIGLGLGIIIDALDRAPEGKELKLKMEALTNGLLSLVDVGWAILKFAALMILATPLLLVAGVAALIWVPLLRGMIWGLQWATEKLDDKALKKILVLGKIGKALLLMSASLVLMALLSEYVLKGLLVAGAVILAFGLIGMLIDKMKLGKGLDKMAKTLKNLTLALLGISMGLILMGLLYEPIMIGVGVASLVILTLGGIFWLLNRMKIGKSMLKISKALIFAAGAILAVAVSLVLSSLIVSTLGWEEVGKVLLLVGAVALAFWAMDKILGKGMKKGAIGLIFAAGAILAIAVAIFLARLLIGPVDTENILKTFGVLVVIAGVAGVFYLAGMGAKMIRKGAIAMMFAAGALIVIAIGVAVMKAALSGMSWEQLGMVAAIVAGLGIAMALAGAYELGLMTGIPGTIQAGSIAMMVAGVALIVIGAGVYVMAKALKGQTWESIGMMGAVIAGVAVAMAGAGFASPLIILGAAAMTIAGVALILIGKGLTYLAKLPNTIFKSGGIFADSGKKTSPNKLLRMLGVKPRAKTNLEIMIEAIADSFTLGPLQLLGIYSSAPALIFAGAALLMIGEGLDKFQKIAAQTDLKLLGINTAIVTSVLADTFGKIGKKFPGGKKSLMQSIFGGGKQSAVADGISSTMGMGSALTGIAMGMQAMANLKFPVKFDKEGNPIEFESMDSDAPVKVAINAGIITGVLADVFGQIGTKYPGGKKGLLASIFGNGKQSPVADGISAVQGMGGALTGIAQGFQAMANLNFPTEWDKEGNPVKFEAIDVAGATLRVMANTWMIVSGLSGVFASIGKNPDAESNGWFGKSNIQKGIDIVRGIGEPLVNLASGVQNMANLKFPTGFDKDGKAIGYTSVGDPEDMMKKVTDNTKMLIRALVEVFTEIGKDEGANDGYWWWSSSSFEKGVEIVKQIADPYKSLSEAIKGVAENIGKIDTKAFAGKMGDIIKVLVDVGEGGNIFDLTFKKTYIESLGSSFEKMKTAVPAIVNGANAFNEKKGGAFFSALVGPTDSGKRAEGYQKQAVLWATIGANTQKMSGAMPQIANSINSMDFAKLHEARIMFEALGVLAKGGSGEDILAKMGESLEEAMEKLADILMKFKDAIPPAGGGDNPPANGNSGVPKSGGDGKPANIKFPTKMVVTLDEASIAAIKPKKGTWPF